MAADDSDVKVDELAAIADWGPAEEWSDWDAGSCVEEATSPRTRRRR